tara:strand:+ start:29 stop:910 length:882 start_codon:yes stop_codon:yes gene_type:complete
MIEKIPISLFLLSQIIFLGNVFASEIYPESVYKTHGETINKEFLLPSSSVQLEGICESFKECKIGIDGDAIYTSNGKEIQTDNIIGWSLTNATNKGGVLLISKNEDYRFLIKYFDKNGNRNITQIGFFNFKTAQNFLNTLELVSGLAPNHDQAGPTTFCTSRGKDYLSGTAIDSVNSQNKSGYGLASARNTLVGASVGSVAGGTLGSALGGSASIAAGASTGFIAGGIIGDALGRSSGGLNLKRNVVSEIRSTPSKSISFEDKSFHHRIDCVDEPLNSANVNFKSSVPIKISK